jgi:hypothetical protein
MDRGHPSLMEAIETLETIVDLEETERELELFVDDLDLKDRQVAWLRDEPTDEAFARVRELFSVILTYLQSIEKEDDSRLRVPQTQKEVLNMMALVGEAAQKLDRYAALFHGAQEGAITGLKEYRDLQHFYSKQIDTKVEKERDIANEKIGDDFEKVKRDIDYELFLLRRENGTPFASQELVDRLKLVGSYENLLIEESGNDSLIQVEEWKDRTAHVAAKNIVEGMRPFLDGFYPLAATKRDNRFVARLGDAVLALKMAASPQNRLSKQPAKSCYSYFTDFQLLLREALASEEYQRLIAYPPRGNKFMRVSRDLAHSICYSLYTQYCECRDVIGRVHHLVVQGEEMRGKYVTGEGLASRFADEYESINRALELHPNGPLLKIVDWLQEGGMHRFDPMLQGNLPERWCDLEVGAESVALLRMPSPTSQERIHRAVVIEEFRSFVRSCRLSPIVQTLLVVNFQDRSSWKEHARAKALEGMQQQEEFESVLKLVSLPKNTEFYHQIGLYREIGDWPLFRRAFEEQFEREEGGFYFPEELRERLFPEFADKLLDGIHRLFFAGSEVLSRRQRLDCIELFYLFLTCKLIELVNPDFIGFCCKDALDLSSTAIVSLVATLHLIQGSEIRPQEWEWLRTMLYAPVLMVRERAPQAVPFNRMAALIETVEEAAARLGADGLKRAVDEELAPLYLGNVLQGRIAIPLAADESV